MKVYASKVKVGDALTVHGITYPVLDTAREGSTVIIWVANDLFITSNYMSFAWNDYVDVTFPDCERCKWDNAVPHTNCLYYGTPTVGHSATHCTADSCY